MASDLTRERADITTPFGFSTHSTHATLTALNFFFDPRANSGNTIDASTGSIIGMDSDSGGISPSGIAEKS